MDWWEIILFVVVITPIIVLWLGSVLDAITRQDLSGAMKVLWILAVLLFPIVGSLVYILVRPTVIVPQTNLMDETWQGTPRGVTDMGFDETRQTTN